MQYVKLQKLHVVFRKRYNEGLGQAIYLFAEASSSSRPACRIFVALRPVVAFRCVGLVFTKIATYN